MWLPGASCPSALRTRSRILLGWSLATTERSPQCYYWNRIAPRRKFRAATSFDMSLETVLMGTIWGTAVVCVYWGFNAFPKLGKKKKKGMVKEFRNPDKKCTLVPAESTCSYERKCRMGLGNCLGRKASWFFSGQPSICKTYQANVLSLDLSEGQYTGMSLLCSFIELCT